MITKGKTMSYPRFQCVIMNVTPDTSKQPNKINSIMKKNLICMLTLLLVNMLVLSSCQKGNNKNQEPNIPTQWVLSENINPLLSMTLTTALPEELQANAQADDRMAVFRDTVCVGVAAPEETSMGNRFLIMIYDLNADDTSFQTLSSQTLLTVRYYSGLQKKTYQANESFAFAADTQKGSISTPEIFTWKEIK